MDVCGFIIQGEGNLAAVERDKHEVGRGNGRRGEVDGLGEAPDGDRGRARRQQGHVDLRSTPSRGVSMAHVLREGERERERGKRDRGREGEREGEGEGERGR